MILDSFKFRSLLVFLAGSFMALAMPPTAWWPLLFVGLSVFYFMLSRTTGWRSFLTGWLFGLGYFLFGLYWIGNALLVPGNDFKWVWPLAILGLPVGLSIFTGLAALSATKLADLKTWRGYGVFVVCLMLSEWLRGTILSGFPWNLYGYAWTNVLPMVQSVSIFGAYGLSLISVLWAVLPGFLLISKPSRLVVQACIAVILISMAGLYGWGAYHLKANPTRERDDIIIRIVQPNISQEDKLSGRNIAQNVRHMVDQSIAIPFTPNKTYAIIWPETAISDYVMQDSGAINFIKSSLMPDKDKDMNRFLISGTLRHETNEAGETRYYNSIVTYDRNLMPVDHSDKSHLVPFGEYIPFKDIIPLQPFVRFAGFTSGGGVKTQTVESLPAFSGLICYEVIFPGAATTNNPYPEWIVTVTNDGWYGDSPGPYQHLGMAIFRAVEQGIPMVRSANTGISTVVDPQGRSLQKIGYGISSVADIALPYPATRKTFFSNCGNTLFLCALLLIAALTQRRRNLSKEL